MAVDVVPIIIVSPSHFGPSLTKTGVTGWGFIVIWKVVSLNEQPTISKCKEYVPSFKVEAFVIAAGNCKLELNPFGPVHSYKSATKGVENTISSPSQTVSVSIVNGIKAVTGKISIVSSTLHPILSVTNTVYVPILKFVIVLLLIDASWDHM